MCGEIVNTPGVAAPIQELILSQPIDIPVFHEVALRLQQMLNDNSYRIEEVIKLVHEDTALASEMLRCANTTYNSGKTPITTIKDAIVRLGSQQVVNLAFTASMSHSKSDDPIVNTYFKNNWYHCHAVAISSAWLAVQIINDQKPLEIDADEVYLVGLFHEIGKLYLLKSIDKLIKEGLFRAEVSLIDNFINEHYALQSVKVMRHYNMPSIYIMASERHATKQILDPDDHLLAITRLSCKMHDLVINGIKAIEAVDDVESELSLLNMDLNYVYDFVKSITESNWI